MNTAANRAHKRLVLHVRPGSDSPAITTSVSLLANWHVQVNLAAVNYICVNHEAMNDCKKKI